MKSQHMNTEPVHTTEQGRALTTALSTVVDYLWEDEQKSYAAAPPDERTGHIFNSLEVMARWLAASEQSNEQGRACPPSRPTAPPHVTDDLDRRLLRIRELVRALLFEDDHEERLDTAIENACELAAILLNLDHDACAGALPRAWQRR